MAKGPLLQKIWDELPEERRHRIQAAAAEEIEEHRALQQLREAINLTEPEDVKLSTLQAYAQALGGAVRITVELPNRDPISFGVGDLIDPQPDFSPHPA